MSDQTPPPEGGREPGPDETSEIRRSESGGGSGGSGEPPEGEGPGGGGEGQGEEPPEELRCANCDAPLEPDQTYCLECGAPTPRAPKLRRGGRTALIIAGALVILGLGAGALAWAVASDDDGGKTVTTTPTIPTGSVPTNVVPTSTAGTATGGTLPTDTTATIPSGTGTLPTDTTGTGGALPTTTADTSTAPAETTTEPTTTEGTTTSAGGGGGSDWPSGTSGWTAIVASAKSRAPAEQKKSQLQSSGQPAGILLSSNYSSLNPGYYVVFSGVFQSRGAAAAQAEKVRAQFPGAYPRQITP